MADDDVIAEQIIACLADPERYRAERALAALRQVREEYADVLDRRRYGLPTALRWLDRAIEDLADDLPLTPHVTPKGNVYRRR